MKYYFILFLVVTSILYSCYPKQCKNEIKFEWQSFELEGRKYKHGAMFLPVYLDSIDKTFKMQFDLGLNVSGIYENPLNTIITKHPYLKNKIEFGKDYQVLKTKTKIQNYISSVDSLFIFKGYGDKKEYDELSVIGSIGANELEKKILIIDFKNTSLKILNNSSQIDKNKFNFVQLEYKFGKIFIPLSINGKTYKYIYDTGASITPITTIDKAFFSIATKKTAKLDTVKLNSWGKLATFLKSEIKIPVQIGNVNLKIEGKSIFYTEEEKIIKTLNQVGVKGLVGNDFFIDDIIVIDLINNKFGVQKK